MATPVIMPKIEMAQKKATVIEWLVEEGAEVEKGEVLLEVETDKVTMQVEAPASGILARLRGEPGEKIRVTEIIAYVLEPGEKLPEEAAVEDEVSGARPEARMGEHAEEEVEVTPVARRLAEAEGVRLTGVKGTGPGGRVTKADVVAALEKREQEAPEGVGGKVRATPAARRIAREEEVELSAVSGTGPRGRVQADDVRGFVEARKQARERQARDEEAREEEAPAARVVPLEGMQRTVAKRMMESYREAPHITFTVEVDMGAFEETRAELNTRAEGRNEPHVSVTALLVKAVGWALERHPWMNSRLEEDEIHLLSDVNVGVAVALEEGLIVPVVHEANRKGVGEIAAELKDLTNRAREDRLRPTDVAAGTFTVSNLGPFGIDTFTAIINPPEVGILAVGAVRRRFVLDEAGKPKVRPMMAMTLSADHRVVDGAVAARFLRDLGAALEKPTLLLW